MHDECSPISRSTDTAPRPKPWTTPRLRVFGDVRDLTLGGSPGGGDSGGAGPFVEAPLV